MKQVISAAPQQQQCTKHSGDTNTNRCIASYLPVRRIPFSVGVTTLVYESYILEYTILFCMRIITSISDLGSILITNDYVKTVSHNSLASSSHCNSSCLWNLFPKRLSDAERAQ